MNEIVSVVITCYNHASYLDEAIGSVLYQTYPHFEIVVVDDGSTDHTKAVATNYREVKYVWQENQGLAAARNTGAKESSGKYLVFLDADDWLYKDALQQQVTAMLANPESMAVAGGHDKIDVDGKIIPEDHGPVVDADHYLHLLKGNFIGMHAAVMYRREVFDTLQYDPSLKAAEDYDLYLKLARKFPIYAHGGKIAGYRIHGNNMSRNIPFMLQHVLKVLGRQQEVLFGDDEKKAFAEGVSIWNKYYAGVILDQKLYQIHKKGYARNLLTNEERELVWNNFPKRTLSLYFQNNKKRVKKIVKRIIGRNNTAHDKTKPGEIDFGSFKRTTPYSRDFGFDRGGAIDRYYIEGFLEENSGDVKGRVLEIADNHYTYMFGKGKVVVSDVLHLHRDHPGATIAGDLSKADEIPIPDNQFDCIILTQTLHFIYDYEKAIQQCHRILKPGGVLLITVPGISQIDAGGWKDNWLWSFTARSMKLIFAKNFNSPDVTIESYGNVFSATAFLWGLGLSEVKDTGLLDEKDSCYQVTVAVRAVKN
ncbi:glycosyltransferase [Danxiaibacter flavus]|uniref:Glycosyltransferase n=1 Tax=Danxiaibacter flavus TaxID=3049108 RepID=A0ABV3ZME9_9BACT|nr:glycosyltransferase [Chitinophagaceae bacterium DXS]